MELGKQEQKKKKDRRREHPARSMNETLHHISRIKTDLTQKGAQRGHPKQH